MKPVYNEWTRGDFAQKVSDGKIHWNEYDCVFCKAAGVEHSVIDVPHGQTDNSSCWGAGLPTTRRECTACHRWDGPWVSTDIVGGGW